jgi:hypothetical protein
LIRTSDFLNLTRHSQVVNTSYIGTALKDIHIGIVSSTKFVLPDVPYASRNGILLFLSKLSFSLSAGISILMLKAGQRFYVPMGNVTRQTYGLSHVTSP